ncbi:MAG: hypothetical protein JO354_00290 [Verrucomicrobia bacterium]|nr:hypothetical protein [Verrucomicrobiota bacterium]
MENVIELRRHRSLVITPQALAWDGEQMWLSSRDLGTLYTVDVGAWQIVNEIDPPGIVWAGVLTGDGWRFTLGKGLNDDRYIYRYSEKDGFTRLFACPDFTGSYLSFDGDHYYLSQWYKGEIHQVDDSGKVLRTIDAGAEICGHTLADGVLYVLRGKENKNVPGKTEEWRIARIHFQDADAAIEDLAVVPFASRSLAFDGTNFWSNHRGANETVSFALPR